MIMNAIDKLAAFAPNRQADPTRQLEGLLRQRVLVLDGAMGTMIQCHDLDETAYRGTRFADWNSDVKGNNDLLGLTQPDIIRDIHQGFLDAGADIIATNTFNATRISQADYAMEDLVYEINYESARLARELVDAASTTAKPRLWNFMVMTGPPREASVLNYSTWDHLQLAVCFGKFWKKGRSSVGGGV